MLEPIEADSQHPGRILTCDLWGIRAISRRESFPINQQVNQRQRELRIKAMGMDPGLPRFVHWRA